MSKGSPSLYSGVSRAYTEHGRSGAASCDLCVTSNRKALYMLDAIYLLK